MYHKHYIIWIYRSPKLIDYLETIDGCCDININVFMLIWFINHSYNFGNLPVQICSYMELVTVIVAFIPFPYNNKVTIL